MPNGTITVNPIYNLMILGDDNVWYTLPEGAVFNAGDKVTFTEWVKPNPPPGFHYAKDVALAKSTSPWSTFKFSASSTPLVPAPVHLIPDTNNNTSSSSSDSTSSGKGGRILNDRTAENDYAAIMKAVDKMNWSGKFGPSVIVETKLKWENANCRNLYLKVKDELHDQRIPGTKLYYYVGAIGNWGKAGFRITGHTKPAEKIESSETNGVLHVENS